MTNSNKKLEIEIFQKNENEIKWDYRLMTKKQRKRFLQKKLIIQNNFETFAKQAKNDVILHMLFSLDKYIKFEFYQIFFVFYFN